MAEQTKKRYDTSQGFDAYPRGSGRFVSASFDKLDDALDATRELESHDYPRDRVSVLMATDKREMLLDAHPRYGELEERAVVVDEVALEKQNRAAEGAGTGGAIGGVLGAAGAAAVAVGTTLVIPPLGIAIAGPVAAALAGLGAGAATGGIVGALVGAGMSEYRAKRFEELVKKGHVIVGVITQTEPEARHVEDLLAKHHGEVVRATA